MSSKLKTNKQKTDTVHWQKPKVQRVQFTACFKYWFSINNASKYRYTCVLLLLECHSGHNKIFIHPGCLHNYRGTQTYSLSVVSTWPWNSLKRVSINPCGCRFLCLCEQAGLSSTMIIITFRGPQHPWAHLEEEGNKSQMMLLPCLCSDP